MKLREEITGVREVTRYLRTRENAARREVTRAMGEATRELQDEIKSAAPRRTGGLERSIKRNVRSYATKIIGSVSTSHPAAGSLEFGFSGRESVREYARRTASGMTTVRAYSRSVVYPRKPFIFKRAEARRAAILRMLEDAMRGAKEGE